MPNSDALLALAEICAAFAGFAALVSVLRQRPDRPAEAVHDLLRLRLVISSGVAGVAAALIPVGIAGYGVDPGVAWRLAALAFLLLEASFPFAVMHCLSGAGVYLAEVSGTGTWRSPRALGRVTAELEFADVPSVGSAELGDFVDRLEEGIRAIGQSLHEDLYQFGGDPSLFSFEAV